MTFMGPLLVGPVRCGCSRPESRPGLRPAGFAFAGQRQGALPRQTHRDDGVQIVVREMVVFTIGSSYPEIPEHCCVLSQFAFGKPIATSFANSAHIVTEQTDQHRACYRKRHRPAFV